eukprot:4011701-Alexandrium_andersonii.AAC.1
MHPLADTCCGTYTWPKHCMPPSAGLRGLKTTPDILNVTGALAAAQDGCDDGDGDAHACMHAHAFVSTGAHDIAN